MEPHVEKVLQESLDRIDFKIKALDSKRRAGMPRAKEITISSRDYRIVTRLLGDDGWEERFNPEKRASETPIVGWAGNVPIVLARDMHKLGAK